MADGPKPPYDGNVPLVRDTVRAARDHRVGVEAELGRIEGDEESACAAVAGGPTDPEQAADFVAASSAACLAVSIGHVHGTYR